MIVRSPVLALLLAVLVAPRLLGQDAPASNPVPARLHGTRPATLAIENVHVIRGDGAPPFGPTSVYVRDGKIVSEAIDSPAATIDGTGCYLLPGLVSTHAHLESEKAGIPLPPEYQLDLWLACGITAVRDVGSAWPRSIRLKQRGAKGELAAPRIFLYTMLGPVESPDAGRERVRAIAAQGADGIKLWSNLSYPPEIVFAVLDEAKKQGLRTTAHIGVGESNALTYARAGITSIEHFYGIPDAAIPGGQDFPANFSYSDETDRFREAGKLWRQADPDLLDAVLQELVEREVAWSPTLAVYEAARDLQRAQQKPWFADCLHPALAKFFQSGAGYHGSFFVGWTTTDEVAWKEDYRIWMDALRRFAALGGTITTGEDAAYIYLVYGFGLVRELELHQEAGFHPLEVIEQATYNGARVLGQESEFGRVLPGLAADLVVVRGNPLANLKCFYPTGCEMRVDGKATRTGGVQFTIKDGWVYHGPTLMAEVRQIVARDREKLASHTEAPR